MAPHAKFFAMYERPFWRDAGLSGTAQSLVGPLAEMHDATTASGQSALMGFLGVDADMRASLGEAALAKSCLQPSATEPGFLAGAISAAQRAVTEVLLRLKTT
jgi:monoamine oxidase